MDSRTTTIRKAGWIALFGNATLAIAKIITGTVSNSLSVISDGIDSSTDVLIAAMTLVAASISAKPGDREHPYGHGRIETVASAVISFIVFFAGGQVFLTAVKDLISGTPGSMPSVLAIVITSLSVVGKLGLAWSQFHYGKISGSAMLVANGKNMRGDVVTSLAVLTGLGLAHLTGFTAFDKIFAILVSLWILKNAVGIFLEANLELMDGMNDHGRYSDVFHAVSHIQLAANPHRVRIRHLGSTLVVDLDIEVAPETSVLAAHRVAVQVENSIKEHIPEVYDVIVHIEPKGNVEPERFGLAQSAEPAEGSGIQKP